MDIIQFKVQKTKSINIKKLLLTLNAFNQATSQYIQKTTGENISLELQSVQKGSDIFNLVIIGGGLILAGGEVAKVINKWLDILLKIKELNKSPAQEIKDQELYTQSFVNDLDTIAEFVNNKNIQYIQIQNAQKKITITKDFALKIQDNLQLIKDIKGYNTQTKRNYENMLIEFYNTTNTDKQVKDKAFCYDLSPNPIGTFITDETLKKEVLNNPYAFRFLVDLEVYKDPQGKILNYRAFNYKDKIPKD